MIRFVPCSSSTSESEPGTSAESKTQNTASVGNGPPALSKILACVPIVRQS